MNAIDWSQSHCGVYLCTYKQTVELMPEVKPILDELYNSEFMGCWDDNYIDVKVHMLMPKQFPCIPNWHCDFRPRDMDGNKLSKEKVDTGEKMYIWTSGPPYTEFIKDGVITKAVTNEWHSFTQDDWHRGTMAEEHCWRCFIRVIPRHLAHSAMTVNTGQQRRHCQVYLDSNDFNW